MPAETAGKLTLCQPFSRAMAKVAASACSSFFSSSPSPSRGPTAWITPLKGNRPAPVRTALPEGKGPFIVSTRSDSACSAGPAAREITPATPPPWARWPFAALTIASTGSSRRLPRTTWKSEPAATSSCARISGVSAPSRRRGAPRKGRWRSPACGFSRACRSGRSSACRAFACASRVSLCCGPCVRTWPWCYPAVLLHFRFCPKPPDQLLDLLLCQLLLDSRLHFRERRKLGLAHVVELDDVVTEARLHRRLGELAFVELHHGIGEVLVEGGRHVPVEVAATLLRAGVLGVLLREVGEAAAFLKLADQVLRLVLVVDQDVARAVLLVAALALGALVLLLDVGIAHRVLLHVVAQVRAHQDFLARDGKLRLHLRVLGHPLFLRLLADDLAVHQLIAHHQAGLGIVRRAAVSLLLHHEFEVRLRHDHAVHLGDRRLFVLCVLGGLGGRLGSRFFRGWGGLVLRGDRERHERYRRYYWELHCFPFVSSGARAVMASAWIGFCMRLPSAWYTIRWRATAGCPAKRDETIARRQCVPPPSR